jgi:alkylation response protein AidB-like acyl-CoA dehydrogenase
MDLSYSPEEISFRDDVRAFLDEKVTDDMKSKVRGKAELTKADMENWHTILNEKGWLAPNWPKKFGGAEWNAVQKHIFEEEAASVSAPRIVPFGLGMLAPVLQNFGSQEQNDYWLPRILSGADWWCQGYSEPGAGSDLASLKTSAVKNEAGTHYIVNGQKVWTSYADQADCIFALVRTDREAPKHLGISFLLIDMDSAGVSTKPIRLISGSSPFCETFFDVNQDNFFGYFAISQNIGTGCTHISSSYYGYFAHIGIFNYIVYAKKLSQVIKQSPVIEDRVTIL